MRTRFALFCIAIALVLVAGCGNDDDDPRTASGSESGSDRSAYSAKSADGSDGTDDDGSGSDSDHASGSDSSGSGAGSSSASSSSSSAAGPDGSVATVDEEAYVDAVMAQGVGIDVFVNAFGADGVRCYVRATVRAFGVAELNAAGVTPETFATDAPDNLPIEVPDSRVPALRQELGGCFDPVEFWIALLGGAPSDEEDPQLSPDQQQCIRDNLGTELALDGIVDLARGASDVDGGKVAAVYAAIDPCFDAPSTDESE